MEILAQVIPEHQQVLVRVLLQPDMILSVATADIVCQVTLAIMFAILLHINIHRHHQMQPYPVVLAPVTQKHLAVLAPAHL